MDAKRRAERMLEPLEVVLAELAALHALLTGAVPLLELAAELARAAGMAQCSRCPARDRCPAFDEPDIEQWPCYKAPAALRELAQGLRALATVPEAGDRRGLGQGQGTEEE